MPLGRGFSTRKGSVSSPIAKLKVYRGIRENSNAGRSEQLGKNSLFPEDLRGEPKKLDEADQGSEDDTADLSPRLNAEEEIGAPAVRSDTMALTEDLIELARERGMAPRVAERAGERSAIVMIPRPDPAADVKRLAERGIITDVRPGHVRISPYFYNVPDDHRALLEQLA